MKFLFESSSWVFTSLLLVLFSILFCVGILSIIRKTISVKELKKNHDVVGFTFSIVGILYSVVLGLTVVNVQNRYTAVLETIHSEAILVADLYQDATFFSEEDRRAIQASLRNYIEHVVQEEWGASLHLRTRSVIKEIWDSYYNVNLRNEKDKLWYAETISKLNNFLNVRLTRQFNAKEHLGSMMWSLLIVGALITVCFMFFFSLENFRSHLLMTALLTGYLAFMLFLIYSLDNVFKGPQAVRPTALEQVLLSWKDQR